MINPRQLEIFMAVCDEKSMTAASKKLYMTQPAVSQTIKDMESQYDCEFFERYGSKLYITEAGKVLYEYARRIMNLYRDLDDAISFNDGVREIRIGANISAGFAHLTELIRRFSERYPDITVKAMVFQAPVLLNSLKNNELDIALVEDQREYSTNPEFIMEPYYKDKIVVIAPLSHPFAGKKAEIKALADETFLFREKSAGVRDMFDSILKIQGINPKVGWECTSSDAIIEAVKHELGIAVLPYLLVKKELDNHEVAEIILSDVSLSRNINITYHKDKVLTEPLCHFIEFVRDIGRKSGEH